MSDNPNMGDARLSEAVRWFNQRRAGGLSAQDALAFEEWLAHDPENEAVLAEVDQAWRLAGEVRNDQSLQKAQKRDAQNLFWRGRMVMVGSVAASLVLVLVGAWMFSTRSLLPEMRPAVSSTLAYRTAVGQVSTITLTDGSTIKLDTDSRLQVAMTGQERRVMLEQGRASFHVAKDSERPFIVAAAGKTVRATGTTFDVRVEPGQFTVILVEGRVRVEEQQAKGGRSTPTDMRPGWRLSVGEDRRWRMEAVDLANATSWHDGMLSFYEDPLAVAVAEMNRYSRRKIVFRGPPPNVSVLGKFKAGDVASLARAVQMNKLVRVTRENDDTIELSAAD